MRKKRKGRVWGGKDEWERAGRDERGEEKEEKERQLTSSVWSGTCSGCSEFSIVYRYLNGEGGKAHAHITHSLTHTLTHQESPLSLPKM